MRVSMTTLLLLKHAGDKEAIATCMMASYLLRTRGNTVNETVAVYYNQAGFDAQYINKSKGLVPIN